MASNEEASMAATGTSGKTLEERVQLIEDRFATYDLIAPPAERRYRRGRVCRERLGRGRRLRPGRRISAAERAGGDCGGLVQPGASPRDRGRHRAFCRAPLCTDRGRQGGRDLLPADPCAGPGRANVRGAQSRGVARLSCAPVVGQPLGVCAHERGLEDQPAHFAAARRHRAGARHIARRAGASRRNITERPLTPALSPQAWRGRAAVMSANNGQRFYPASPLRSLAPLAGRGTG